MTKNTKTFWGKNKQAFNLAVAAYTAIGLYIVVDGVSILFYLNRKKKGFGLKYAGGATRAIGKNGILSKGI